MARQARDVRAGVEREVQCQHREPSDEHCRQDVYAALEVLDRPEQRGKRHAVSAEPVGKNARDRDAGAQDAVDDVGDLIFGHGARGLRVVRPPGVRGAEGAATAWNATIAIPATTSTATIGHRVSRWPTVEEIVGHGIAFFSVFEAAARISVTKMNARMGPQTR